jgi:hypothetical protein
MVSEDKCIKEETANITHVQTSFESFQNNFKSNDVSNSNAFRDLEMKENQPVHLCDKDEVLEGGILSFFSFFYPTLYMVILLLLIFSSVQCSF